MSKNIIRSFFMSLWAVGIFSAQTLQAQEHSPEHGTHETHSCEQAHHTSDNPTAAVTDVIMHHIGNSNEFEIMHGLTIPLPCVLYAPESGLTTCMSSKFEEGTVAYNRYVLNHGVVNRIKDSSFPNEEVKIDCIINTKDAQGDETGVVMYQGKEYPLDEASLLTGTTSFYDFSISKNIATMLLTALVLLAIFISLAGKYKKNPNAAPKGFQSLMEPIILFIRDDIAKPSIGHKYEKYLPLLSTIFFFILINNLIGLIPIFPGGANVTGNIGTTMALALIAFIVTNINGNKHYWEHIFWMPGLPTAMKIFLAPIEFIGIFTKPISLMIRLFANITAGHIIILSLVGLVFVFGNLGQSALGASAGAFVAVPFTLFMNVIELIVAFIQAYIFTMLTASYIGGAIEEPHHH